MSIKQSIAEYKKRREVRYMICKNCKCCKKGWFISKPNDYVCIGVQEPFIIKDISQKCTEYTDKNVTKKA